VLVKWKRAFVRADEMFTDRRLVPLPKHRLESAYVDNKANFLDLAFWHQEFVGSGPFKVREWVLGSHLILDAHERYVLGRPQIDELVVKFIQDPNTLIANVLTGEVDLTIGGVLSLEQAVQVRDRWTDGKVDIAFESWITIYPQFMGPNPPVIGDVQFRRALLHAIDRQEMADAIQYGLVPVAHGFLNPNAPEYQETEKGVVRYGYDPRRAGQLIEALGYVRGADAGFRDGGGQRLAVEIRALDPYEKPLLSVSDYWQRLGLGVEPLIIPRARSTDQEWRSLRPGFELLRQPNAIGDLDRYHSSQVPTKENNFTGTSKHRYANPELDTLLDALFTTIPRQQRLQLAEAVLHHISDQVVTLPLYYDAIVALVGKRVQNMGVRKSEGSTDSWNAEAWDIR
jgi:peptide/nickel transport system substrate-binding protein